MSRAVAGRGPGEKDTEETDAHCCHCRNREVGAGCRRREDDGDRRAGDGYRGHQIVRADSEKLAVRRRRQRDDPHGFRCRAVAPATEAIGTEAITESRLSDNPALDADTAADRAVVARLSFASSRRRGVISVEARCRRDELILKHLSLVRAIANRVRENLPVQVELDDLVHAGILGLFDAVDKYDPSKKVVFHLYAKHRIRGAILDSLRQLDWASRDLRKRYKSIETTTQRLAQNLGRLPTEAEVAQSMGVTEERFRKQAQELYTAGLTAGQPHRVEKPDHSSFAGPARAPNSGPTSCFAIISCVECSTARFKPCRRVIKKSSSCITTRTAR